MPSSDLGSFYHASQMMLCQRVRQWWLANPKLHSKPFALVLHTSCVNYSTACFEQFRRWKMRMILPDNVAWELKLLRESRHYGKRANCLLDCAAVPPGRQWDLEQLYEDGNAPVSSADIFDGTLLFLFGDLNKQDEFLYHAADHPNCYVLVNPTWIHDHKQLQVCRLSDMRKCTFRVPKPLTHGTTVPQIQSIPQIHCICQTQTTLPGAGFCQTGQSGTYSCIYTHPDLPDHLFKIYRKTNQPGCYAQTGTYARKLRYMQRYHQAIRLENTAFPEHLLTDDHYQILGYSMQPYNGVPIRQYILTGWRGKTDEDAAQTLRNLMLLLLEIHNRHMLVSDLSYNNILVDDRNRVYLVDCDSFQFHEYPGGAVTKLYQHRELGQADAATQLREPRHEYFALAVLLFQCLMLEDPLPEKCRCQANFTPDWNEIRFPLEAWGEHFPDAHPDIERNWLQTDLAVRQMLADALHFRRDHSIGAWIRALHLSE